MSSVPSSRRSIRTATLFAAAIALGAGAAAIAITWASKAKSPERLLRKCDDAANLLAERIARFENT